MGNLPFLPLEIEEDINDLFLEFSWLEEKGELIKESRISFDFKVTDEEYECCYVYRFFGGVNTYLRYDSNKELDEITEKPDQNGLSAENDSFLLNKALLQNSLKYSPSLNGVSLEKNEPIINKIVSVINMGNKIKHDIYPNLIFYEQIDISGNYLYVKRAMMESTIKDKLDELSKIKSQNYVLKRWLEFQSIIAVSQLHSLGLFHGDIKTENMLVNHLYIVKLTDVSPWKPVFIDSSDLRFWTVFFENQSCNSINNVLRCNLSPERFLSKNDVKGNSLKVSEPEFKSMLFSMDIFSLGCTLNEIESNEIILTINDTLKMSKYKKYYSELSNNFVDWIKENFLDFDWEKRPEAFRTLLKLLNMNRTSNVNSLNIYLFEDREKSNFHFCKSFPLFFYPLSIIMQNKIFNDLQIQIIILNIVLPVFLELFIIKDIYPNNKVINDHFDESYTNEIEDILSKIEIKYFDDWSLDKLKSTFQNKFESDIMKDLILNVLLSDIDCRIFDEGMSFETTNTSSHLNIKGFFSIFQLLLNHWDNEKNKLNTDFNSAHLINNIIMDCNLIQLNIDDFDNMDNRKSFFELIKNNELFVEDLNSSSMLYLHYLSISLRQFTHIYGKELVNTTDYFTKFEIYNSIYLLSINTINILLETLSEEYKEEIAVREILPSILQYLTIYEYYNAKNSKLDQSRIPLDFVPSENYKTNFDLPDYYQKYHKESIVTFEIFNFINNNIMKYLIIENEVLVDNETNHIIYDLVILNIDKWMYLNVTLKNTLVVKILLLIAHKALIPMLKHEQNRFKLNTWITEILTSSNSILKKSIVKKNEKNKSILEEILEHCLSANKTEIFISEILPYLIDQLNDKDIDIRYEFCELIVKIMERMEIIFILPYGKFCIEKCLTDKEFKLKHVAIRSINKILNRIISIEIKKLSINESEIIVHELIESIVNNLSTKLIISYYPLCKEFENLLRNVFEYSKKYNDWLVFILLFNKFFNIKEIGISNLFDSFEINKLCDHEFLIYYLNKIVKDKTNYESEKQEKKNVHLNNSRAQTSTYTKLISYFVPCVMKQLNLCDNFDEIIFISSLIQKEAKFSTRKKSISHMINCLTNHKKNAYNSCEPDLKKPLPLIKGNYLGSIYNHRKLVQNNNITAGAGFNIYQKLMYINEDVYSCSTNSSSNAGIYLHKLNVYDQFHYWNLITDQSNNHIFKFNDNSYITSMISLSSEFSVITGNNLGTLSKIHIDASFVTVKEHYYYDENLLFKQKNSLTSRSPMITLIGKIMINFREMIISVYCNGDIYIIDSEHLSTEICFSVPKILGSVIDYYTNENGNDNLIFFATDENAIIIINLFYSKVPKIWKIIHHELKISNVTSSYIKYSSNIMLVFNKKSIFALFDWISGKVYPNKEYIFQTSEIKENLIHIYDPSLFSSKLIHPVNSERMQKCNCLCCQTQRVRIFGNYLNQYLTLNKYNSNSINKECLVNQNVIGPFNGIIGNNLGNSHDMHKYYIFNDGFGNVYQQNFFVADIDCQINSLDCIIGRYPTENSSLSISNTKSYGHKDTITSLNIYSFNNNEIGLLTSSRDGIISYWN